MIGATLSTSRILASAPPRWLPIHTIGLVGSGQGSITPKSLRCTLYAPQHWARLTLAVGQVGSVQMGGFSTKDTAGTVRETMPVAPTVTCTSAVAMASWFLSESFSISSKLIALLC